VLMGRVPAPYVGCLAQRAVSRAGHIAQDAIELVGLLLHTRHMSPIITIGMQGQLHASRLTASLPSLMLGMSLRTQKERRLVRLCHE
jgi:hypothetical protein